MLNSIAVYANKRFLILLLPLLSPFQLPLGRTPCQHLRVRKLLAALQKTSCKAKDLQVTLNLLLSVKADGVEEQIQRLESKLATMKKITQMKELNSVDHTTKINAQIYPGKTEAEIKAHLESVHELEIGATHTHALLSASVSKGLKSYVQAVTKGKPNPYVLWHALKDRFHNKSLNLQANLQQFNVAQKEQDEQMMDFSSSVYRPQQLQVSLETTHSLHVCTLVSQVTSMQLRAPLQAI